MPTKDAKKDHKGKNIWKGRKLRPAQKPARIWKESGSGPEEIGAET
jgi:hypothetical protein